MTEIHRIKRYANRKLYDTTTSSYVSLEKIHDLIRQGIDVEIVDSQTGEDISSITLAQVVVEVEKSRRNLLPLDAIKDLLQRGSESVLDFLEQSRRAGLGALSMADDARERAYRRMVEQGEMAEDEARDFVTSLGENLGKQRKDLERSIDRRVRDIVDGMRLPSRTEIEALNRKLDRVLAKLDDALSEDNGKAARRSSGSTPKAKTRSSTKGS